MTNEYKGLLNDVLEALSTIRQECLVKTEHDDKWVRSFCGQIAEEEEERLRAFIDDVDKGLLTKLEAANNELDKLIDTGGKSFTMYIPARPYKDTDLVFAASIKAAKMLADAVEVEDEQST